MFGNQNIMKRESIYYGKGISRAFKLKKKKGCEGTISVSSHPLVLGFSTALRLFLEPLFLLDSEPLHNLPVGVLLFCTGSTGLQELLFPASELFILTRFEEIHTSYVCLRRNRPALQAMADHRFNIH